MNAEILAVGTELLMGQIVNTNAQYISSRLPDIGINVYYHSVVGDNPVRLRECLKLALQRSDIVIMTGGLGPTQDDLTKETAAQLMGRKLVLHQESYEKMKEYFRKLGRKMTENNVKQAYMPENSIIIPNNNGTAPGCIIENEGKVIIMLPGPPREMKPMFEETVIPYLKTKSDGQIVSKFLRVFGIGESLVETMLMDIIDKQTNPTVATYAKEGEVTIRVTAKSHTIEESEKLVKEMTQRITDKLGDAVYSTEDENIEEVVARLLMEKNVTVAFAESCTGGLISQRLTSVPGVSKIFNRGIVTYSNQSKVEELGVKQETLDSFGAVSRQTATEMARGIRNVAGVDIGLAVTGIAGPGGGTAEKPVGLVYVALADGNGTECKELRLTGDRERIRNITSLHAFDMIRRKLI